ncbi:MAG: amino acid permease [Coxiellaceae bacterium]|nr:amino acid permease [Coxiellaceae bacterium]
MNSTKKPLSVLSLVAINVIAIDSLRTLPFSAEYGFSAVFYYLMAALVFFLPVALVSAELATAWPETGGVYVWTREAFGKKIGFFTIWLQWFYNIVWYPTIMSLIAVAIAYVVNPALEQNKLYMISIMMIFFWLATGINCLGMRASSLLSNLSAVIGTILPMLFIIVLGGIWLWMGKPIQITFSAKTFFPDLSNIHNLVLLIAILYGLVGMEMSASHARDVNNPQKDYPKAVLYSIFLILITLVLGSLAISLVIPAQKLSVISGLMQAFALFFEKFHMMWFMPILSVLIVLGALGGAAAWMLGPSRGMQVACQDGSLPRALGVVSKNNVPVRMLLMQGGIFTVLCSVFVFMPTVSSGFWALTDVTAILALLVYVMMFPAAIVLRYKYPQRERLFKIPGGKVGLWLICLLGLFTCIFAVAIGFVPPSQIPVGNVKTYELVIISGVLLGCAAPFLFSWVTTRNKQ